MPNKQRIETIRITPAIRKVVKKAIRVAIEYEKKTKRKLGVTGEIGEVFACVHPAFSSKGLELVADPISAGFDAIDKRGQKYQIKAKRGNLSGSARVGRFSKHKFDFAIFIFFGRKYNIEEIYEGSWRQLKSIIDNSPRRAPRLAQIRVHSKRVV